MIERGAKELYEAIITAPAANQAIKDKARHLYHSIVFTAFDWQREGVVDALAHAEDEDIRQRTDEAMPRLPKKEIDKIIRRLNKEMNLLASQKEFERAAQIRNRIEELKKYSADVENPRFDKEGGREWED